MANYNKSFNFRNGVQVDNDNFIVNSAGLVGIGTSIPYSYLDVHGVSTLRDNVTVTGLTSTTNLFTTGISTVNNNFHVGSAITSYSSSGIISATKFYGDGSSLSGVYAVSTLGWFIDPTFDGGVGIAYTQFKVGVGTTNAPSQLTVNGGTDDNIALFVSNDKNSYIQFKDSEQSSSVQIGARADDFVIRMGSDESYTFLQTGEVGIGSTNPTNKLEVAGVTSTAHLTVTGVSTFIGISTFKSSVVFDSPISTGVGATVGIADTVYVGTDDKAIFNDNLEIFAGDDSVIRHTKTGAGNDLSIEADTTVYIGKKELSHTMAAFRSGEAVDLYHNNTKRLSTSGVGVTITSQLDVTNVNVSSGTTTGTLRVTGITSTNDTIHVLKTSGAAIVAVGESALGGYNGYLRYGETGGGFKYSNSETFDLVTTSPGSFNFIYDADIQLGAGSTAGDVGFQWLRGANVSPLMTLTGIGGSLGIGITTPIHPLHVSGIATFTSNLFVGSSLEVKNNIITPTGNITLTTGNLTLTTGDTLSAHSADLFVDNITTAAVGSTSLNITGVSTTQDLVVDRFIGLGTAYSWTDDDRISVQINSSEGAPGTAGTETVYVGGFGDVGIGTTCLGEKGEFHAKGAGLGVHGSAYVTTNFVVGRKEYPTCGADFELAGDLQHRFLKLPSVTTAQRGSFSGELTQGSIIWNSSTKKINVYNGTGWEVVTSA